MFQCLCAAPVCSASEIVATNFPDHFHNNNNTDNTIIHNDNSFQKQSCQLLNLCTLLILTKPKTNTSPTSLQLTIQHMQPSQVQQHYISRCDTYNQHKLTLATLTKSSQYPYRTYTIPPKHNLLQYPPKQPPDISAVVHLHNPIHIYFRVLNPTREVIPTFTRTNLFQPLTNPIQIFFTFRNPPFKLISILTLFFGFWCPPAN